MQAERLQQNLEINIEDCKVLDVVKKDDPEKIDVVDNIIIWVDKDEEINYQNWENYLRDDEILKDPLMDIVVFIKMIVHKIS